jgi:hypothetical protein
MDVRASDSERDATVEQLREAAAEGRLTLEELTDRIEAASDAVMRGELVPLTTDLPVAVERSRSEPADVRKVGDIKRKGAWLVPAECRFRSYFGAVIVDLREARSSTSGCGRSSTGDRAERFDGPRVMERVESDVGLLRHGARRHADRLDGRSEIKIGYHEQRLDTDPPWPTRVLHAVGLPDRHHHTEDPSPHARVEHQTVIRGHAGAPREATLPQNARPTLLDPAGGKRAARVANRLEPVSRHRRIVAAYSRSGWPTRRCLAS